MLRVQTQWSLAVGAAVVVFAVVAGLAATRMQVLLVLLPGIALFGLTGIRQVFYAGYQTARLGRIDIATNVVQLVVVSAVALSGGGPVAVATALSAMIVVNIVFVAVRRAEARRLVPPPPVSCAGKCCWRHSPSDSARSSPARTSPWI